MPIPEFIVELRRHIGHAPVWLPAVSAARKLAWVHVTDPMVHANGDHAQYLDHVSRMDLVEGKPFPADDESLDARWCDLAELPRMSADMCQRIKHAEAGSPDSPTVFDTSS